MPLPGSVPAIPGAFSEEKLVDLPTYGQADKPASLVSMIYNPSTWSLNTIYATGVMGYSLTHRSIYGCKLEPNAGLATEGYQVESYNRKFGATTFEITRMSQEGILKEANYCTGEGENRTCYKMTPGDNHDGCTQDTEKVLTTYALETNPFYDNVDKSPDRWSCQDAAGTVGLCLISYSVPMNALAFAPDGQAWAAGDDGILFQRIGQNWKEVTSPASHPLYDLSFASATDGWAVGDRAEVIRWDGSQWKEMLPYHGPGEGPGGSTQILYAVDAYAVNEAWMVGTIKGIDGKNSPYILHWNGKDMLEESGLPECNCGLSAVLVRARNDVYAAGGSDLGAIIFHWDGTSWTSTQVPGADHLYALYSASDGSMWAGGIEVARDQQSTRGALFHWDGYQWQRVALPPLRGGIYAMSVLTTGQIVLGGDFSALRSGLDWQPIAAEIAGYGWIVDMEQDKQNSVWALTRSGNIFKLAITR